MKFEASTYCIQHKTYGCHFGVCGQCVSPESLTTFTVLLEAAISITKFDYFVRVVDCPISVSYISCTFVNVTVFIFQFIRLWNPHKAPRDTLAK